MRALITGGAGFVGSHLAEHLLSLGQEVTVLDDLSSGRQENVERLQLSAGFRLVVDTIADETAMDRLAAECDVIYHLAAAVGVEMVLHSTIHTIETNVMGTASVLRAADGHGRKLLLASTSEIYGKSAKVPFGEDDDRILGPTTLSRWSYSSSKALDEFLALAYAKERGLPVVICRLFNTIGPRQTGRYGMVVPRFVGQALDNEPLTVYGDGTQTRCFADVRDVVRGMAQLMAHPGAEGQVYNLGSSREVSINELARLVISLTGSRSEIAHIPYEQAYGRGFEDLQRRIPNLHRVHALIGWTVSIPLEDTLRSVIEYLRIQNA